MSLYSGFNIFGEKNSKIKATVFVNGSIQTSNNSITCGAFLSFYKIDISLLIFYLRTGFKNFITTYFSSLES